MPRVIRKPYENDIEEIVNLYDEVKRINNLDTDDVLRSYVVRQRIVDSDNEPSWFFSRVIDEEGITALITAHKEESLYGYYVAWIDGFLSKNNYSGSILLTEFMDWCNIEKVKYIYTFSEFNSDKYSALMKRVGFTKYSDLYRFE